jgi:hypothetical protein
MATNLERFKKDLDRLITQGDLLEYAMVRDVAIRDEFTRQVREQLGKDKADAFVKSLPNFNNDYESWYSESLALLRQLLPDRVGNFISFYEKPKGRKSIEYGNYVIKDYLQKLTVKFGGEVKVDPRAAVEQYRQQLAIVKAARVRFESSLFEIRQMVQADLFDGEIDTARELLKNKFLRPAGAIFRCNFGEALASSL